MTRGADEQIRCDSARHRWPRMARRAASAIGLAIVCTGCATGESAPPTPSIEPSTVDQRDVLGFADRPCELLTPTQIAQLGLAEIETLPSNERPPRPVCSATRPRAGAPPTALTDDIDISVVAGDAIGPVANGSTPPDVLDRTTINGLPAVTVRAFDSYVVCEIAVETAPGQGFRATLGRSELPGPDDSCDLLRKVGESVTSNLPPRQR